MSKSELAREMGVTRQTVQAWLKKGSVSRENLRKLSLIFNTTTSSLLGDHEILDEGELQQADIIKKELKQLIDSIPSNHIVLLQYLKKMLS